MADDTATRGILNGYIVLGRDKRIMVEEVSVNLTRDLTEKYNAGVRTPSALVPGQEKIDFTIKRVYRDPTFTKLYEKACEFPMALFNNSTNPGANTSGDKIFALTRCVLSQDNIGPLNGQDFMMEDIQGKALGITFEDKEIAAILNPACDTV